MKNKIVVFLICAMSALLIFPACTREDAPTADNPPAPVADENDYVWSFYIDGQEVSQDQMDYTRRGQEILVVSGTEAEPESRVIAVMAFSSLDRMLEYTDAHNMPVRYSIETGDHLADYAADNGYIQMYEETGSVPDSYLEYCNSFFPDHKTDALLTWYDDCWTGGAAWVSAVPTVPFMAPGWGNRVSRFYDLAIYGPVILYDRTFFRNRLLTWHSWGWQYVPLCTALSFANNRTESALH